MRQDIYTAKRAAEYLGISLSFLLKLREKGPTRVQFGSRVFFLQSDLDKFIEGSRTCHFTDQKNLDSIGMSLVSTEKDFVSPQAKKIYEELAAKRQEREQSQNQANSQQLQSNKAQL